MKPEAVMTLEQFLKAIGFIAGGFTLVVTAAFVWGKKIVSAFKIAFGSESASAKSIDERFLAIEKRINDLALRQDLDDLRKDTRMLMDKLITHLDKTRR